MYCVEILKRVGRTGNISQLPVNLPEHQNIDNPSFDILIQVKYDLRIYRNQLASLHWQCGKTCPSWPGRQPTMK